MRAWVLVAFVVGCTHTETPKADPAATARDTEELRAFLRDLANERRPMPPLGTACTSGPLCGEKHRIALSIDTVHEMPVAPCSLVSVRRSSATSMENAIDGCVAGSRLFFVESCMHCRTRSTTTVQATLDETTPAQREHLRTWLKLPAAASIESRADWEKILRTP